jgi:hypothetical protein
MPSVSMTPAANFATVAAGVLGVSVAASGAAVAAARVAPRWPSPPSMRGSGCWLLVHVAPAAAAQRARAAVGTV